MRFPDGSSATNPCSVEVAARLGLQGVSSSRAARLTRILQRQTLDPQVPTPGFSCDGNDGISPSGAIGFLSPPYAPTV
ncbi:hypothetical protein BH09ACT6_BH09ACT6_25780 [soil metagenome]